VSNEDITTEQAELASQIPMAQDVTAEADSGGHTDNRPAIAMIPTMLALRDQMQEKYGYAQALRVGAAGGISTPASAAAAFAMGAAYILTGSVNQACVESGTSDIVRKMLAETKQGDVTMAPAADMFEMGVKVQVLKRGTMFAMRGAKLYEVYRNYERFEDIPQTVRDMIEKKILRQSFEAVWEQTQHFFAERDPRQIERANQDPKHKMALIFRWYLGLASLWANSGEPSRKIDYQIWCGPAMGAFNEWVKGSCLEKPEERQVVTVALNILYGAGVIQRLNTLRMQGVQLSSDFWKIVPLTREELNKRV
jgi:PfaD family protein